MSRRRLMGPVIGLHGSDRCSKISSIWRNGFGDGGSDCSAETAFLRPFLSSFAPKSRARIGGGGIGNIRRNFGSMH